MLLRFLLAAAALLLLPAAAHADSIVFVKDANVWVASPDGTGQRQLTRDGTADHPYRSPSQADDGTVAASYLDSIRLIRRDGSLIRELDPPSLVNSVSHAMDGTPVDVALSPDGKTIAYTFVSASCPVGASCGARAATGYVTSAGAALPGNLYLSNPSWVGNSRTLVFGGYLSQVNTHDLGAAEDVHWFDDYEIVGQADATDLGDGELSVQGDKLALVRSYGGDTHITWYTTNGSALPTPQCATGKLEGLYGPTWAPDGQSLAWGEPDGVWVKPSALDCTVQPSLVIPGGTEPDWGPAGVGAAAKPRPQGAREEAQGDPVGAVRDRVRRAGQARAPRQDDREEAHDARRRGHREADVEGEAREGPGPRHRDARRRQRHDPPEEAQPSVTFTDEITIGSSGFSDAGSVSATPILSTTSWPAVTLPRSA